MFEKTVARVEAFFKGMVFDCHSCGQCVLSKTSLICPMSCPKGLRNGPCGGTLDEKCEVYPDKNCVWVRIHKKNQNGSTNLPKLLPSPDSSLFHTSSYINAAKGTSHQTGRPLPYLELPENRTSLPLQTKSLLEKKLKNGEFVYTCEIRSPREGGFDHFTGEAEKIKGHFDAVNTTAYLNARPSLASPLAAARLKEMGLEPICQSTCRDQTKTSFVSELIQNKLNNVNNVLCLTGDSYVGTPKIKQVFDMDSSLMLFEARHIREKGVIHFTDEKMKYPPKLFLGTAINPFTTPMNIPILRLKQKVAVGADFTQTQVIVDMETFKEFMKIVVEEGINKDIFIIAGIPVITSRKAFTYLPQIPGVKVTEEVKKRLDSAESIKEEGVQLAREQVAQLKEIPGVSGIHLMLFGANHGILPEVIKEK